MHYLQILINYFGNHPYVVVLLGFFLILFLLPVSEELILFVGGSLSVIKGHGAWVPTLLCGIFGVVFTDSWFYFWSRFYGQKIVRHPFIERYFQPEKRKRAKDFVKKYGAWGVFIVRFIPGGVRIPVFVTCGLFHMPPRKFLFATIVGVCISAQISFWAGYYLSDKLPPIEDLLKVIHKRASIVIYSVIAIVVIAYIVRCIIKKQKEKKKEIKG
jgi:membrane protein DedA with SNARE-associated domain